MSKRPWLVESDKPSYQVLKWIGGGGFGQVFKVLRNGQIVACKQVHVNDAEAALDEYDHMRSLRGAPHIATLHDGLEFNRKTNTLSFFMDYYRGKDLDRQVQMLKGAAERFTESQIVEIGYQIVVALEFCHSRNILHQDVKPMNVLLREPWNPLTQRDVPDLFVADFGIASRVHTIATRLTAPRGTPGYEAPEIRGQDYQAAFSQKSDVYAFGCVLYRLCTLEDPNMVDNIEPAEILADYSVELLSLVSSMLKVNRDERPTASQVKEELAIIARQLFPAGHRECPICQQTFISKKGLQKHRKKTGHHIEQNGERDTNGQATWTETDLHIRGAADAPARYYYEEDENDKPEADELPPCVVCWRGYDSKSKLFRHLYCGNHVRRRGQVLKRLADNDVDVDEEHRDKRLA